MRTRRLREFEASLLIIPKCRDRFNTSQCESSGYNIKPEEKEVKAIYPLKLECHNFSYLCIIRNKVRHIGDGRTTIMWTDNCLPKDTNLCPIVCLKEDDPPLKLSQLTEHLSASWRRI
jgi:hypothetical protein